MNTRPSHAAELTYSRQTQRIFSSDIVAYRCEQRKSLTADGTTLLTTYCAAELSCCFSNASVPLREPRELRRRVVGQEAVQAVTCPRPCDHVST